MNEPKKGRWATQERADEERRNREKQRRLFPGDRRLLDPNPEVDRLSVPIGELIRSA